MLPGLSLNVLLYKWVLNDAWKTHLGCSCSSHSSKTSNFWIFTFSLMNLLVNFLKKMKQSEGVSDDSYLDDTSKTTYHSVLIFGIPTNFITWINYPCSYIGQYGSFHSIDLIPLLSNTFKNVVQTNFLFHGAFPIIIKT